MIINDINKTLYFTVKGVQFMLTGTRKCSNGTWQVSIKNVKSGKFTDMGYDKYMRILKNSKL